MRDLYRGLAKYRITWVYLLQGNGQGLLCDSLELHPENSMLEV